MIKVNGRMIGTGKVGPVTARVYGEFVRVRIDRQEGSPIFPKVENPELRARNR